MNRFCYTIITCALSATALFAQPNEINTATVFTDSTTKWAIPFTDSLVCFSETFIGTPYNYGSKGPDAFDCSGFVGFVFKHFDIILAASSTAQYKESPMYVSLDSMQIGDLIFFMGRNGRKSVGHVGIIVDVNSENKSCRFIHAATHGGVIFTDYPSSAYYNQRFMGISRYPMPEYIFREIPYDNIDKTSSGE